MEFIRDKYKKISVIEKQKYIKLIKDKFERKLAKELGLGVGISSGANLIASILAQEKINKPVVTVFADDNKKYLTTDLSKKIDENSNFISNKIKLKGFTL